ncbi:ribosomal protein L7Ae/L30e/S12e/Gadd45 family protein isoform X2 [Wolffia australiana]
MGRKRGRKPPTPPPVNLPASSLETPEQRTKAGCFQDEKLTGMLQKIGRAIEEERTGKGGIPDKIWTKQHFAIGVNDVTRVLERMSKSQAGDLQGKDLVKPRPRPTPLVQLQAVLVAIDCVPRLLTQHIPAMASSAGVPVVLVRDHGRGSLRLGELVKLKTAIALGVKARGSLINRALEELVPDSTV